MALDSGEYKVYRYRWVVLLVYGLVVMVQSFIWISFTPIGTSVQEVLGVNATLVSMFALIGPFIYIFLSPFAGSLSDRKGYIFTTRIGVVLMIVAVAGKVLFQYAIPAGATLFWVYIMMQAINGVGGAFVLVNMEKVPARWFPENQRALATGSSSTPASAGRLWIARITPWMSHACSWGKAPWR